MSEPRPDETCDLCKDYVSPVSECTCDECGNRTCEQCGETVVQHTLKGRDRWVCLDCKVLP